MFASAERIAGTSPLSPIGVESAVEMLESLILVLAATGELACADLIEEIVFNVIGAAGTESLSAVQDFLLPNQTEASRANGEFVGGLPSGNPFFGRGVTPGAVALISAYPMFLESLCMTRDDELNFFGYAPCTISTKVNGATLRIKEDTGYPFRNTIVFRVEEAEGEVNLRLNFRVPARTTMQLISGGQVVASGERSISAKCILRTGSTFMLKLNIPLTVSPNRDGSVSLYKGSLLMASRIGEETSASKDGTAAVFASHKWAFAPVLAKRRWAAGSRSTTTNAPRSTTSPNIRSITPRRPSNCASNAAMSSTGSTARTGLPPCRRLPNSPRNAWSAHSCPSGAPR